MQRPTWATILGVLFIIIALFGIFGAIQDINVRNLSAQLDQAFDEMIVEIEDEAENNNTNPPDSADLEAITMFGDSLVMGEDGNVDLGSTMKNMMKISEYRMSWMIKFGYMSIALGLIFLIGGILLFKKHKLTIPLALLALTLGIAFGIFRLLIYSQDTDSSQIVDIGEKIGGYAGIFFYIILLIVLLVCDRTYYSDTPIAQDYYDGVS